MIAHLPVGEGAVARAIAFTRRFAEAGGLSGDPADQLVVIVEEWAANIVEHSRAAAGSLIVLRLQRAGVGVLVVFTDAGIAFDPRAARDEGPNLERDRLVLRSRS
jgi:serine/threonine-protein kinase RsbW